MDTKALVEGKYYRVMPITKFLGINESKPLCKNLETKEGLAVEEKQKDNNYLVINFIRFLDDELIIENVDSRITNVLEYKDNSVADYFERIQDYNNCLNFAIEALKDIWEKENEGYFEELKTQEEGKIFHYKGFKVELLLDDYGQQFYFKFNGKEYSCGAYNMYPEAEIKFIIDEYLKENKD